MSLKRKTDLCRTYNHQQVDWPTINTKAWTTNFVQTSENSIQILQLNREDFRKGLSGA